MSEPIKLLLPDRLEELRAATRRLQAGEDLDGVDAYRRDAYRVPADELDAFIEAYGELQLLKRLLARKAAKVGDEGMTTERFSGRNRFGCDYCGRPSI